MPRRSISAAIFHRRGIVYGDGSFAAFGRPLREGPERLNHPKSNRTRLDRAMLERGLAESLEMARALIMAGRVSLEGGRAVAAGQMVSESFKIAVKPGDRYVGRGGLKLDHALDAFGIDVQGLVAVDVGASTGGFTDCLLQRGARRVYAVDAGYGQLDYSLRRDSRVVSLERVNARNGLPLEEVADLATVDVSFISVTRVLPSVAAGVRTGGLVVVLVKPQFEARRPEVGRGGVVRDARVHARVLGRVVAWAVHNRFRILDLTPSPITGDRGNREFFVLLATPGSGGTPVHPLANE